MKDNRELATAILERVEESAPQGKISKSNPAAVAMINALKAGDPDRLTQSLSDFIRMHSAKN